ncbi:MAG: hypothetical protein JRD88_08890 [Deltaproteobacteria bacterium]|jgi:hypothetical protein|nr:hypothetical protein [Deltaproteobacteria bacterium]
MFIKLPLFLVTLFFLGCGAKTIPPDISTHSKTLELNADEGLMIVLEEYEYEDKTEHQPADRIVRHIKMQEEIHACLAKEAKKQGIKVYEPLPILHDKSLAGHVLPIKPKSKDKVENSIKAAPNLLGVRYLVSAKINTDYDGALDFDAEGDEGVLIVGVVKQGIKRTHAILTLHDVRSGEEVDTLQISSSGKQGWTAGLAIIYIFPVPWYWPWWSMTETETCEAIGESLVSLISQVKGN